MIENIKLGMKMLRHTYGLKTNIFMGIGFLAFGIIAHMIGTDMKVNLLGEYMFICTGMLPAQMIFSLNASNMIQASPIKRQMQTTVPTLITWVNMMILYLLFTVVRTAGILKHPETAVASGGELLALASMMMILMAYLGVAYKYFIASIFIIITVVIFLNYGGTAAYLVDFYSSSRLNFGLSVGLGIGLLAAGGFLQYLISCLFYKAPVSKMAMAAPLRREL